MRKNFKKRFMSLTMAIVMMLLNFSMIAFAEEVDGNQTMPVNVISVEQTENGKTML